jgi:Mn2+/Fe2+ NRAMP family transporter
MKSIIVLVRETVGPATVMASGVMGAGSVAAYILAGAWFRYELLWVLLFILPIFVVSVDSSSRIGAINQEQGMFSLIRQHIHPGLAWFLLIINIPLHFLILMGQMSVMSSSFMSLFGLYEAVNSGIQSHKLSEVLVTLFCAITMLWLILSQGYQRMQKLMSLLLVMMFICFLLVALRGFSEITDILKGLIPRLPADLPVPGTDSSRLASSSIAAMAGGVLPPAVLLGMSYLSSDAKSDETTLGRDFRKSVINLGLIFGCYSVFIIVAGGYALFPLLEHAQIDTVHEASKVLTGAFPDSLAFVGPMIFSAGIFIASVTTIVFAAQLSTYFCLDMVNKSWHYSPDNLPYHYLLVFFVIVPALIAPFWDFPALLKIILLMGINVFVVPVVIIIVMFMVNHTGFVRQYRAEWWRNLILLAGLILSIILAFEKLPDYMQYLDILMQD